MAFSAITVGGLWVLLKDTLIESVGKTISYKFDKNNITKEFKGHFSLIR